MPNKIGVVIYCFFLFPVNPFALPDTDFEPEDTDDSVSFPTNEDIDSSFNYGVGSVSDFMCKQYAKIFTQTVQVIPLVTNPKPVSWSVANCENSVPLIVGGEEARPGEFPHMAALGYIDFSSRSRQILWNCGGTLISDQFVLTAAHCIRLSNSNNRLVLTRVRLGGSTKLSQPAVEEVGVAETLIHPEYRPPAKYNDLALVRLSRIVRLSRAVAPACLNTKAIAAKRAIATGWGHTEFGGKQSDVLMKVALTIVPNNECSPQYTKLQSAKRTLPLGILPIMMCAGEKAGGKDACQGDSGGPLQVAKGDGSCLYNIIGVTSFGKGCANPNSPGVYTRISEYIRWIEQIVWPRN